MAHRGGHTIGLLLVVAVSAASMQSAMRTGCCHRSVFKVSSRMTWGGLRGQGPQSLVVSGLFGQVGKQVEQVLARVADPPGFLVVAQHGLQHREGDQLRIGDFRSNTDRWPSPVELV